MDGYMRVYAHVLYICMASMDSWLDSWMDGWMDGGTPSDSRTYV